MRYQLQFPPEIKGKITLPTSKSISNRALIIYALTQNGILPNHLAVCDDTDVMKTALVSTNEVINILAAGTSMRFLTAYLSVTTGTRIITGTERMQNRPIHILVDALRKIGADIQYTDKKGFPPLRIVGKKLEGSKLSLDGSISSQFITALLLIAPTLEKGLQIELKGHIASKPYIDMTLALMNQCGAKAYWYMSNSIQVEPQPYKPTTLNIEPDWSAASYWFSIVALSDKAEILLTDMVIPSLQGDFKGAKEFEKLGVRYKQTPEGLHLFKTNQISSAIEIDFTEIPDLAQTFVVAATLLNVPFKFTGLDTLRIKETDRIDALVQEMKKLGYILVEKGNKELSWKGERCLAEQQPIIETYDDHRMAMAFAPAAIVFPHLLINEPDVVTKSYPNYWEDLTKAGVNLLKK